MEITQNAKKNKNSKLISWKRRFLDKTQSGSILYKPVFIIIGLIALIWFLVRVIPKPSRAAYPCLQTAFPIASAFIIWLTGSLGFIAFFKKVPVAFRKADYKQVALFVTAGLVLLSMAITVGTSEISLAGGQSSTAVIPINKKYDNTIDALTSKVSVVRSDKALASEIQYEEILSMVREAVALAGGMESFITDGKSVMIKPNLVNYYTFRPIELNGVTTDHRVLRAVVQLVRELNPTGKIILAEGCAEAVPTLTNFQNLKYSLIPGIDEFIGFEAASGGYREYTSDSLISVELPDSMSLYPDSKKPNLNRKIYYNKRYYNTDVLITVPVLKNHQGAGITGGVKNIAIGATPANIYGNKEWSRPFLRSQVIDHDNGNLDKWIHDYYAGRPADFVIIDGLQGVSNGPGGGGNLANLIKNQHNMRLIMAGKDVLATDAIAGLIFGHDAQLANHLVYLHNDGFGTIDPALIEVIGTKVHSIRKFFGFDNTTYATRTAFDKFVSTDYQITGSINGDKLHLSVSNPIDLARMTVSLDDQKINKFIVGGFGNITLDINNINVTEGKVDVYFEDRYLNPLSKQFTASNVTRVDKIIQDNPLILYPNPAVSEINLRMENASSGVYRVSIIDLNGREIVSNDFTNHSGEIEYRMGLESLKPGNYIYRVSMPDGTDMRKQFLKK